MNTEDSDKERGRLNLEKRARGNLWVNPKTLKLILAIGPWVAKILTLGIQLVKLFKE